MAKEFCSLYILYANLFLSSLISLIISFINFSRSSMIDSSSCLLFFKSSISFFNEFFSRLVIFFRGMLKMPSACFSLIFKFLIKLTLASEVSLDFSIKLIISLRLFIACIKASTISCLFLIFFNK